LLGLRRIEQPWKCLFRSSIYVESLVPVPVASLKRIIFPLSRLEPAEWKQL